LGRAALNRAAAAAYQGSFSQLMETRFGLPLWLFFCLVRIGMEALLFARQRYAGCLKGKAESFAVSLEQS